MDLQGELIRMLSLELEPDTLHRVVAQIECYVESRISEETEPLQKRIDKLVDRVIEGDARMDQERLYNMLEGAFHPDKKRGQ